MISIYDLEADEAEIDLLCRAITEIVPRGGVTEKHNNRILDLAPKLQRSIFNAVKAHHNIDRCDYFITKSWGSYHPPYRPAATWHDHSYAHWAFCYYLRKPFNSGGTVFEIHNQIQTIDADEGQIAFWPASLRHQIAKNNSSYGRFSLAGDIILVAKPGEKPDTQLPEISNWVQVK